MQVNDIAISSHDGRAHLAAADDNGEVLFLFLLLDMLFVSPLVF
jgi:hypothetical protein